jgi:phosphatidylglycerophosphate synthase
MAKISARASLLKLVPVLLTGLRALLAPAVVWLSMYAPRKEAFAICLVAAFLSDVFDGIIARRLGVATPALRRLDSAADTLSTRPVCLRPGVCIQQPSRVDFCL